MLTKANGSTQQLVLLAHPDYILLFVAEFDFANPNSPPKSGVLYFKTEHRNLNNL